MTLFMWIDLSESKIILICTCWFCMVCGVFHCWVFPCSHNMVLDSWRQCTDVNLTKSICKVLVPTCSMVVLKLLQACHDCVCVCVSVSDASVCKDCFLLKYTMWWWRHEPQTKSSGEAGNTQGGGHHVVQSSMVCDNVVCMLGGIAVWHCWVPRLRVCGFHSCCNACCL